MKIALEFNKATVPDLKTKKLKKKTTLNLQRQQPKEGYITYAVLYK
jgi:hypothetical protein